MQASSSKPNTALNHGALIYERVWPSVVLRKAEDLRKSKQQRQLRRNVS